MTYLFLVFITCFLLIFLGIKWEIKVKIVTPWTIFVVLLGCLTIYFLHKTSPNFSSIYEVTIALAQTLIITFVVTLIFFYRDPDRIPPTQERVILSPADGRVLYVTEISEGKFPFAIKGRKEIPLGEFIKEDFIYHRGLQVGIGMNLLNVHVNRAPIRGKISRLKRIPGGFHSLKKMSSLLENERVFTIIENDEIKVGIVQIASRLVRRIIPYVKEGDNVQSGQRIGFIRFGSQVDVLIAAKDRISIEIKPDDDVKAGISVIATY